MEDRWKIEARLGSERRLARRKGEKGGEILLFKHKRGEKVEKTDVH